MGAASNSENPYSPPRVGPADNDNVVNAVLVDDFGGLSVYYQLNLDDLSSFNVRHMRNSPSGRRAFYVSWLAIPALVLALSTVLALLQRDRGALVLNFLLSGAICIFWIALWPSLYRNRLRRNVEQLFREGSNKGVFGPHRLSIAPQTFIGANEYSETKSTWEIVERIEEHAGGLDIYMSAVSAIIVPRRCFASDEEFQRFAQTARDYWRSTTETPFAGPPTAAASKGSPHQSGA